MIELNMLKQTSINDLLRAHNLGSCAVGHTDRRTDGRIALFQNAPLGRVPSNTSCVSVAGWQHVCHFTEMLQPLWALPPMPDLWLAPATIRYDTIRDAILTCSRKPTRVSLIYRTETLWEIHVISPEEEREAMVGRICRKLRFQAWN